ncbi:MAG: LTA synthase family protein [Betaproteobacteria bacterium]|nr:LTA synthase family protein [Betaproteobacteria bacterium]
MNARVYARNNTPVARVAAGNAPQAASRHALLVLFAAIYLVVSGATRALLAARAGAAEQVSTGDLFSVFAVGLGYDLVTALYLCAPFALWLLFLPQRAYRSRVHRALVWIGFYLVTLSVTYLAAVEYFFFDEFNARFNYVAVEYLIYPHEVFINIWESYPVARAILAAAVVSGLLLWALRSRIARALEARAAPAERVRPALVVLIALAAAHSGVDSTSGRFNHNRIADELAANGIYSFFSAAATSDLDYRQYYTTIENSEAIARARRIVAQPNATFLPNAANPLARRIQYAGPPRLLNVIVLLEESLGAGFLGAYGDTRGLTPNLDRIARESLVFTNTYATGTRTVRGMEAVTASFPPVPAESLVKRRGNEGMFNWSGVMRRNGYSPTFVYGGYGTFDNMNYFFGNNGYRVIDRTDMDAPKFSNIWGVSDEDLFRNAFRVYDEQHARGERIFSVVMTTSNHKPFTFPEGVNGVAPRGGGREAGVRYADYAIGGFMDELRRRPYFRDTLVVIVADHGARVYGREDIPLPSYEIPFIVYAPRHIAPRRVAALVSQIDVAPTVLGLLNISYDSVFFGKDVLAAAPANRSAPLNHNRDIALYSDGIVNELGFRGARASFAYDREQRRQRPVPGDEEGLKDTASLFQIAYDLYRTRRYRLD